MQLTLNSRAHGLQCSKRWVSSQPVRVIGWFLPDLHALIQCGYCVSSRLYALHNALDCALTSPAPFPSAAAASISPAVDQAGTHPIKLASNSRAEAQGAAPASGTLGNTGSVPMASATRTSSTAVARRADSQPLKLPLTDEEVLELTNSGTAQRYTPGCHKMSSGYASKFGTRMIGFLLQLYSGTNIC